MATLLELVDQGCGELGLAQPTAVIGSANNLTMQMSALIKRLGRDLVRGYEWNLLTKTYVFQTSIPLSTYGSPVQNSAVIGTMGTTAGLVAGMVIIGTGIPPYAEIVSVDSGTQITMNMIATASASGLALTFVYQDYAPPIDYDRMIPDTNWDYSDHWSNIGPMTSQGWQPLKGGTISVGPRERFRIQGGKMRIFPALTNNPPLTFSFEYVSKYWVYTSGATVPDKLTFTADTDFTIFPDDLMLAGFKYYFRRAKRLDYGEEKLEFEGILSERQSQDQPASALSLTPAYVPEFIGPWSIPEGSWQL